MIKDLIKQNESLISENKFLKKQAVDLKAQIVSDCKCQINSNYYF